MGIFGKFVGSAVGFMVGGPFGAMAGAAFGHALDSSGMVFFGQPQDPISFVEKSQLAFFVGTFSMLAKVASADGPVRREEIETVESFIIRDLGLNAENQMVALQIFHTALESPACFESFAEPFYQRFQHKTQLVEALFDILLRVSVSDGALNAQEEVLLLKAARTFNIPAARYSELVARYAGRLHKAYAILGCTPQDTIEQVKKRYRHLAQAFHPDKMAGRDLSNELLQLAQEQFRHVQAAYDEIKKERGVS